MKAHRGRQSVAAEVEGDSLSVSASRGEREVAVTLVNPRHDKRLKVTCTLEAGSWQNATARILHDDDLNAGNSFEAPDRVVPRSVAVEARSAKLEIELPPLAVATVSAGMAG
jgi:alpha-L-arabinofuranosidase